MHMFRISIWKLLTLDTAGLNEEKRCPEPFWEPIYRRYCKQTLIWTFISCSLFIATNWIAWNFQNKSLPVLVTSFGILKRFPKTDMLMFWHPNRLRRHVACHRIAIGESREHTATANAAIADEKECN